MFAMIDLINTIVNPWNKQRLQKTWGHTRADNTEKTVGVHKGGFSGLSTLVCPYGFLWIVHLCVPLRFSLDCPFLCAP
jgi:hypothetical protein